MEPVDPNTADRIRWDMRRPQGPRGSRGNETHFERLLGSAVGLQIRWSLVTSTATVQEFGVRNSPFAVPLPGSGNWDAVLIRKLNGRIYRAAEHFAHAHPVEDRVSRSHCSVLRADSRGQATQIKMGSDARSCRV